MSWVAAQLFFHRRPAAKKPLGCNQPSGCAEHFFAELESIPYANADASYRVAPLQRIGELEEKVTR